MKQSKKLWGIIAVGSFALCGALFSVTTTAAPSNMVEWEYYSDAARTNYVGFKILTCSGRTYTSGQQTSFFYRYTEPCGYPRP